MNRSRVVFACAVALVLSSLVRGASAQPPAAGDTIEMVEYTVVDGDTCGRIAQRMWGNARRYDIIHSYNPEMGPPPHHLVAGTVLHLPRVATAAAALPDARVTAAVRTVNARSESDEAWRAAHVGLDLFRGWHVTTEEQSSAELTFRDTSVVAMRAGTLVIIFGQTAGRVRQGGSEATLERGTMRTALGALRGDDAGASQALSLHVTMPAGTADMHGGSSVVSVDAQQTSRVSAHVGAVSLRGATGAATSVPEGMGSSVAPHERPTPPRPLPAAPSWENGPRRFFGAPGRGSVITGAWATVASAHTYHVEVATSADGRDVVASTEVPDTVTHFELHGFPAGTYYVRVSTIDGDFFESRTSDAITLTASDARFTAPGASEDERFSPIDPSEEPGPLAVTLGTRVTMPDDVHCTQPDGTQASSFVVTSDAAPSCVDASGAPVALLPLHASTLALSTDTPEIAAGTTHEVSIGAAAGPMPEGATIVGEGVTVSSVERRGDRLVATVQAPATAGNASLAVVVAGTTLATTQLTIAQAPIVAPPPTTTAPPVEEPVAPTPPAPPGALTEAVGAIPFSQTVGLRDIDVRGIGGRVGIAGVDTRGGALARVMLEAFGAVLDDQLRFSIAMPIDFANPRVQSWTRGSADLYATVGWLPLRRGPVSLLVDAGLWIPTQLDHGLANARLVPSVEAAWLVSGTFHLRTRQAAMLDLANQGARLWASAYGMDARLLGPVGIAFEFELTFGDPDGNGTRADYAFVPGVTIDFSWLALHVGGRFGIASPTFFGPAGLFVTARMAAF
jgi:hypothetical protein